jgi:hypothetical protein
MIDARRKEPSVSGAPCAPAPEEWMGASCLGSTCLKWRDDGELSDRDAQLILRRLAMVDRQAVALLDR